jgi:hypothetical protein
MAKITFLGGPETGDVAFVDWLGFRFHIHQAVECNHPHIIAKARGNRFFRVEGGGGKVETEAVPDEPGEGDDAPASPLDHDGDGRPGGSLPAAPGDRVMSVAELIAAADADPPMAFFTFRAEAKKLLGDNLPATKAEIVDALKALPAGGGAA